MARYCKECGLERFDLPVFVKRHWYLLAAGGLIACAVAVRLALVLIGWPHTNSEEGTMGLEALHILQRGERPVYLYGQNYMGTAEAYLGALAFRIFGVSLVALRLGMIAFYALFLAGVFWTTHLLYSRRVALVSLAVLIVGTPFVMQIDLLADGGKAETLAFGALLFALASWLVLARPHGTRATRAPRRRIRRVGRDRWAGAVYLRDHRALCADQRTAALAHLPSRATRVGDGALRRWAADRPAARHSLYRDDARRR
jgi:hypothetical protein